MRNESVFPLPEGTEYTGALEQVNGSVLTKRELFAAMAMQGWISDRDHEPFMPENTAAISVRYADALLRALEEPGEPRSGAV